MTRRRRRLTVLAAALVMLGAATALVLVAMEDSLVFFYSPSDIAAKAPPSEQRLRLGGIVLEGSVGRAADGLTHEFTVTDLAHEVRVAFTGILPDLFREGQGIVAQGRLDGDGVFRADQVLAKHDETYMPPEVAEALKRAGRWQGEGSN